MCPQCWTVNNLEPGTGPIFFWAGHQSRPWMLVTSIAEIPTVSTVIYPVSSLPISLCCFKPSSCCRGNVGKNPLVRHNSTLLQLLGWRQLLPFMGKKYSVLLGFPPETALTPNENEKSSFTFSISLVDLERKGNRWWDLTTYSWWSLNSEKNSQTKGARRVKWLSSYYMSQVHPKVSVSYEVSEETCPRWHG